MDETLLQSQINQYTVKKEKLLDDKVIQTSKGNLKVFSNSIQATLIHRPCPYCLPVLGRKPSLLRIITGPPANGNHQTLGLTEDFFNVIPEVS